MCGYQRQIYFQHTKLGPQSNNSEEKEKKKKKRNCLNKNPTTNVKNEKEKQQEKYKFKSLKRYSNKNAMKNQITPKIKLFAGSAGIGSGGIASI